MCIWNKVLVGLISVASLVFFYMAARALQTETAWSKKASDLEKSVKQFNDENYDLFEGTGAQPGIRQLRVDLYKLLLDRRRMWSECDATVKTAVNDGMAEITVGVNPTDAKGQPVPHGIAKDTVLYAFEEANAKNAKNKGQYLGEFKVAKVGDKQIDLVPTYRLSPREINKLDKAKGKWALYEIMPRDGHDVFASLSDADKKALLPGVPAESVREYLKDGKPAEKDDPQDCVVAGNYVRPLLDYTVLFNHARDKRVLLLDAIAAVQTDNRLLKDAVEEAHTQADACVKDIATTTAEKEAMERDRGIVKALHEKLDTSLGAMEAWIARLTETNQAIAGRIAKLQLEAAQRIDQRTRGAMAQSGAGRL
jgi:hypothetical protein